MAARDKERYYWIKLPKDFFKRHDMQILEGLPNGEKYELFYLKLMLESVDHEGTLRFSETIPYDEYMLSSITRMDIDTVRSAMTVLSNLGMIEIFDDKTLFLQEAAKLLGSETYAAKRKRELRDDPGDNVPRLSPVCPQEIEIDIDTEIERKKEVKEKKKFFVPSLEEVTAYCDERHNGIDPQRFLDFYEARGWMIGKNHMKDWKAAVRTWEGRRNDSRRNTQDCGGKSKYADLVTVD